MLLAPQHAPRISSQAARIELDERLLFFAVSLPRFGFSNMVNRWRRGRLPVEA
jgi:hypothetical protein